MLFLSLYLVQIQGYSQLQSGLTFLPFTILMIAIARFAGSIADKHGPRLLLIIGPAIAGTGLLLLSFIGQTNGPADYWTTFFPGILVLGLGMSLTVAPLTATVMGAVSDQYAGTASGVNNAVSRIAGVFANAIFGALAFLFFSGALQDQLQQFSLSPKENQAVMAQVVNLGNAKVPPQINPALKTMIQKSYHEGFIYAYSRIMQFSAILGYLAAVTSFFFIKNNAVKKSVIG
jgi:MFS family permease